MALKVPHKTQENELPRNEESEQGTMFHICDFLISLRMPPSTAFIPASHTSNLNVLSHLVHSRLRTQNLDSKRYPTAGTYMVPELWAVETAVQTMELHPEVYLNVFNS